METAIIVVASFVAGVVITLCTAALASTPLRDPHDPESEYL